jgi:hypothetical protein
LEACFGGEVGWRVRCAASESVELEVDIALNGRIERKDEYARQRWNSGKREKRKREKEKKCPRRPTGIRCSLPSCLVCLCLL